ncbi:MAG: HNH endonuclease [Planctomycetales bacterium]|nr:HNH endonuclease [Planctomycetales bacterium]
MTSKKLREAIRKRARGHCEYCRVHEEFDVLPFQPDHIIAEKHEGPTVFENLALSCYDCNLHKGPNLAGFDKETSEVVRLFHPRQDSWIEHFRWDGPVLVGTTPIGRVTVAVLGVNAEMRVALRRELIAEAVFPPATDMPNG